MIEAVLDAGCRSSWVTGDKVYGQAPQLRSALEARGVGYVLAVACTTRVPINQDRTIVQADTTTATLPRTPGTDGEPAPGRRVRATATGHGYRCPDSNRCLLIRRNLTSDELAFYLRWPSGEVALSALVRVAGIRMVHRNTQRSARRPWGCICRIMQSGRIRLRDLSRFRGEFYSCLTRRADAVRTR